ncbi:hybrid sensor histidine kinase/response regulator [Endothiovibrio diazotrophicus]
MELDADFLEQLLGVFRTELEDQLELIVDGLLTLEKGVGGEQRHEVLHRIFRAAHNIKGAARGVEMGPVSEVAHTLESLFSALEKGNRAPSSALITTALEGVDTLRRLGAELAPGEAAPEALTALVARLEAAAEEKEAGAAAAPAAEPSVAEPPPSVVEEPVVVDTPPAEMVGVETESPPAEEAPETVEAVPPAAPPAPAAESQPPAAPPDGRTLRVSTAKLDEAVALAEELQITKLQMEGLRGEVRALEVGVSELERLMSALPAGGAPPEGEAWGRFIDNAPPLLGEVARRVGELRRGFNARTKRLEFLGGGLQESLRMLRLVPFSTVARPLARSARDIAVELDKRVELVVRGEEIELDRYVLEQLRAPLTHLLRNAVDHGIEGREARLAAGKREEGRLELEVSGERGWIHLTLRDDGRGIDLERVAAKAVERGLIPAAEAQALDRAGRRDELLELIFLPGFSSRDAVTALSGRGVGLDVVRTNLREIHGRVWVESRPGEGCAFHLQVPLTLATDHGLVVRVAGEPYVLPITNVERIREVAETELGVLESSPVVDLDGRPVPLYDLAVLLGVGETARLAGHPFNVVFLAKGGQGVALTVEEVIGEQEIVIKPFRPPLVAVRHFKGACLDRHGEIVLVLDPGSLVAGASGGAPARLAAAPAVRPPERPRILVVDDSITTRTLEKNILESRGYRVTLAVDGIEGWRALAAEPEGAGGLPFELVISDIEMPRMDGFELTAAIREEARFDDLPIIIVSSLASDENKRRAMAAGADAYIVKGEFDTATLVAMVQEMLGESTIARERER